MSEKAKQMIEEVGFQEAGEINGVMTYKNVTEEQLNALMERVLQESLNAIEKKKEQQEQATSDSGSTLGAELATAPLYISPSKGSETSSSILDSVGGTIGDGLDLAKDAVSGLADLFSGF